MSLLFLLLSYISIIYPYVIKQENPIEITDMSYYVAESNLLGTQLEISVFDVFTDQKLYFTHPNFCQPKRNNIIVGDCEKYCDYSGKGDECGVMREVDGVQPPDNCTCSRMFLCEQQELYETMEDYSNGTVSAAGVNNYRFFWNDSNKGFQIHLNVLSGQLGIGLSLTNNQPNPNNVSSVDTFSFTRMDGCPNDFYHGVGTYFVGVAPRSELESKYQLFFHEIELNTKEVEIHDIHEYNCGNNTFCPPIDVSLTVNIPSDEIYKLQFTFDKCERLMFQREILTPVKDLLPFFYSILDDPVPTPYRSYFSFGSEIFTICPLPGQDSITFQIEFIDSSQERTESIYISSNPDEWNEDQKAISELGGYSAEQHLQGSMKLICEDKEDPSQTIYFSCDPGGAEFGTSCQKVWQIIPTEDKLPFWPIPRLFYQLDFYRYNQIYLDSENRTLVDNQLSLGLLLRGVSGGVSGSQVINFISKDRLDSCEIYFPPWSSITSKEGEILNRRYPIQGKESEIQCDYTEFFELSESMNFMTDTMSTSSLKEGASTAFLVDSLSFLKKWQDCEKYVNQLTNKKDQPWTFRQTNLCNLKMIENTTILQTDACCNETLEWTQCCSPRDVYTLIEKKHVGTIVQDTCQNLDCVSNLLEEYIFYDEMIDGEHGCSNILSENPQVIRTKELEPFNECKNTVYGIDGTGVICYSDSMCKFGYCDTDIGVCVRSQNDRVVMLNYYFECVINTSSTELRFSMYDYYGLLDIQYPLQYNLLKKALMDDFVIQDCISYFGRTLASLHYHLSPALTPDRCGSCFYECFGLYCDRALQCESGIKYGRMGSVCAAVPISVVHNSNQPKCILNSRCNWNESMTEEECLNDDIYSISNGLESPEVTKGGDYFCGYCYSPDKCVSIGNLTEEECSATNFCLTANGDIDLSITTSRECLDKGRCTVPCPDGVTCTSSNCRFLGTCNDQEIKKSIATFGRNYSETGFCLTPMSEWNSFDCSNEDIRDFPYSHFCVRPFIDEQACEKLDGIWHVYATNIDSCEIEVEKGCSQPDAIPTLMRSAKPETQCSECGGTYESIFNWKQAQWVQGSLKKGQWIKRDYTVSNWIGSTIDLVGLADLLGDLSLRDFLFDLKSELSCRLTPMNILIQRIICNCENSECLSGAGETVNRKTAICPSTSSTVVLPPVITIWNEDSSTNQQCDQVVMSSVLYRDIGKIKTTSLSTSFRSTSTSEGGVVNRKGATIGEFLQDGIKYSFDGTLYNIEICITVFDERVSQSTYEVVDIARRVSDTEVIPMDRIPQYSAGEYCFSGLTLSSSQTNEYFLVKRDIDWENKDGETVYSSSELTILTVMFVLYLINFLILFIYEIVENGLSWEKSRLMNIFFILAMSVRAAYFLGIAIEKPTGSESWLEFIGVELPSLLYISALSVSVVLWANVTMIGRGEKHPIEKYTLIGNIVGYILFIVLIIVNTEITGEGKYSCYNRLYEEPSQKNSDILRIVYRVILTVCALVVGALLAYWGGGVFITLFSTDNENNKEKDKLSNRRRSLAKRWLFVIIICTGSVVAQCIFFISYTVAIDNGSADYALFLIPFEIIPVFSMFLLLHWNRIHRSSTEVDRTGQEMDSEKQ